MSVVRYREFLNTVEHGGIAYVTWAVGYKRNSVQASFSVRDCNNEAVLDFYVAGKKSPKNELAKLEILKDAVAQFETAYLVALDKHKKRLALRKARKKKA